MNDDIRQAKITKSLISTHMRDYAEKSPELKPLMAFYREVFSVQKRHAGQLPLKLQPLPREEAERRLEAGKPLIRKQDLEPDTKALRILVGDILDVISAKSPDPPEGLEDFRKGMLKNDEWLTGFAGAYLDGKPRNFAREARKAGLEPALGTLIAHTSLAPFYWKQAPGVRAQISLQHVPFGACPVCGARPIMGFLRPDDGLRVLECSLCGTRWGTPRMACAFCHTQDRNKLRFHFAEKDRSRRVYVCDSCKAYLKVTDRSGITGDLVVPLEDMATAYLDEVAQERGYHRACNSIFG